MFGVGRHRDACNGEHTENRFVMKSDSGAHRQPPPGRESGGGTDNLFV